jgi:acyl-coenzyme A thioesterase PaaI-like protein
MQFLQRVARVAPPALVVVCVAATTAAVESERIPQQASTNSQCFGDALVETQGQIAARSKEIKVEIVPPLPGYKRLRSYSLPEGHMDSFKKIDITRRFNRGKHFIGTLLRKPEGIEKHEQWLNPDTRELLVQVRLGEATVGHPGIVHGGATATILDNAFGMLFFCCDLGTGFTANLNIDYCAPLPAGTNVTAHLTVAGIQGSKVHMRGVYYNAETGVVYAQARCLFIAKHVPTSASAVGALQRYLREGLAAGTGTVPDAPNGAREQELAASRG